MTWIPVAERLPEPEYPVDGYSVDVLAFDACEMNPEACIRKAFVWLRDPPSGRKVGQWRWSHPMGDGDAPGHITHWQPLPPPPESE